ncbi:MAG: DnaD domain protein [Clostridiales bacterium]|jgi:DnaD/phage-associated family protein|nr:DnaD domain protein [Clostridiales bacterium]
MFAKLSTQRAIELKIPLDILFIEEYMPHAPDTFVKVYLFGLSLCSHNIDVDNSIQRISKRLAIDSQEVLNAYEYWQEQGLINILSTTPISVEYLPIKEYSVNYRKKYSKDKYADFNRQLQSILPNRQIMQSEYLEYYNAIESLHMTPDAMIGIISYCVRLKGIDIGYKYILAVARNLAKEGILTFDAVNNHLDELKLYENDIHLIFKALSLIRSVDHNDKTLYLKWTKQYGFKLSTIVDVARKLKRSKNIESLDAKLTKYYNINKLTDQEILDFETNADAMLALAKDIYHNLGQRYDHLGSFVDTYIPKWLDLGFDRASLIQIAQYCFKKNYRTIEELDNTILKFYKLGLTTTSSIDNHLQGIAETDLKIKAILETVNHDRMVNPRDRDFYRTWTFGWVLSDELILYAASLAQSTSNPMQYINATLADWHNKGISTIEQAKATRPSYPSVSKQSAQAIQNNIPTKIMTAEQLNALFDSLDPNDM